MCPSPSRGGFRHGCHLIGAKNGSYKLREDVAYFHWPVAIFSSPVAAGHFS